MDMGTKAIVFFTMLFLMFSTTACNQSGETKKPVKADVAEAVADVEAEVEAVEKE